MCNHHHCDDCCEDNYELGESVRLQPIPREQRGIVFSVRFDMDEADALMKRAEFHGVSQMKLMKDAVLDKVYLPAFKLTSPTP